MIKFTEYVKVAKQVMDYYRFTYIPRGLAIAQCANWMKQKCDERPHISETHKLRHLAVMAKFYYIQAINEVYKKA